MISGLEISGIHYEVSDKLEQYIRRKLGHMDRFIDRHSRESAKMEVRLREVKQDGKKQYECEVSVRLPRESITVKESTINMFAAVDIVETKLRIQLKKYKDQKVGGKMYRRVLARFKRRHKSEV